MSERRILTKQNSRRALSLVVLSIIFYITGLILARDFLPTTLLALSTIFSLFAAYYAVGKKEK